MPFLTAFYKAALTSAFVLSSTLVASAAVPACGAPPGLPIPMAAELPFTADESITNEAPVHPADGRAADITFAYSVARDNDGRVAIRLKSQDPGDATVVSVTICDPIAGTTTSFVQCFDNNGVLASGGKLPRMCEKKVAKVLRSPHRAPNAGAPFFPDPSKPLPPHMGNSSAPREGATVDLGTKEIDGMAAHGYRNLATRPNDLSSCTSPVEETKEWWISEESAIAISEVNTRQSDHVDPKPSPTTVQVVCSFKQSLELSNIQHADPAPELFELPPDYDVVAMIPPEPKSKTLP